MQSVLVASHHITEQDSSIMGVCWCTASSANKGVVIRLGRIGSKVEALAKSLPMSCVYTLWIKPILCDAAHPTVGTRARLQEPREITLYLCSMVILFNVTIVLWYAL